MMLRDRLSYRMPLSLPSRTLVLLLTEALSNFLKLDYQVMNT